MHAVLCCQSYTCSKILAVFTWFAGYIITWRYISGTWGIQIDILDLFLWLMQEKAEREAQIKSTCGFSLPAPADGPVLHHWHDHFFSDRKTIPWFVGNLHSVYPVCHHSTSRQPFKALAGAQCFLTPDIKYQLEYRNFLCSVSHHMRKVTSGVMLLLHRRERMGREMAGLANQGTRILWRNHVHVWANQRLSLAIKKVEHMETMVQKVPARRPHRIILLRGGCSSRRHRRPHQDDDRCL